MSDQTTILLLEDEPLILLDLELAAEDRNCAIHSATTAEAALNILKEQGSDIDIAVLDVSLADGKTCFPVASALNELGVPFILHSGDLDRHNERIRDLDAYLIAKPAAADRVIAAAIVQAQQSSSETQRIAAE